jgi:hypothetical protein
MTKDQEETALVNTYNDGRSAYTYLEKIQAESAFIQMKADLMFKFENTGFKDDDERREIWRKMQTVAWLEQSLQNIVDNGKIAEVELKGFAKIKQKLKGIAC